MSADAFVKEFNFLPACHASEFRCGIGNFAVSKTATCDHWVSAPLVRRPV